MNAIALTIETRKPFHPVPLRPRPPRPAGEQAINAQLYAQIRQAIAELSR